MRLLITDLTDMSQGMHCVAGWDVDNHRMVRPLPGGSNWSTELVQKHKLATGCVAEFQATGAQHNGDYPHSTEDVVVDVNQITWQSKGFSDWVGQHGPNAVESVQEVFGSRVIHTREFRGNFQGVHVPSGTHVPSLGAINIPRIQLELKSDSFKGGPEKLKAIVNDGDASYVLSVSSHALKLAFEQGGLPAAKAALPSAKHFHVRLGLARPFSDAPDKCNLMLNGVHG